MKVALAQLNYTIGDFEANYIKMKDAIEKAEQQKVDLVLFSELSICGYSPLDLLHNTDFVNKAIATILRLAKHCTTTSAIVGGPSIPTHAKGKQLLNSAWLLQNGEALPVAHKTFLPSYNILNEYRYFQPNTVFNVINFKGKRLAITIGEDLWDDRPAENLTLQNQMNALSPIQKLAALKPDLIINIAAQPFAHDKTQQNRKFICSKAAQYNLPIYYINQTGANTQLIYEGASMVVVPTGEIAHQLKHFEEEVHIFETDQNSQKNSTTHPQEIELIYKALVLGVQDYFKKSNLKRALIGLSGGLDSALVAAIAVKALGADNVHGILMPSQYSSEHSITDAVDLAKNLGISYETIPIKEVFLEFKNAMSNSFSQCKEDVTEENIQARIRGTILMAYSNKFGHILLNTSNKSESAVGYGTLYGDMNGGLSVIGDLYKTKAFELAHYINKEKEIIPTNTITKPPSAELSPGQMDSDSLPDYELLDTILFNHIENNDSAKKLISKGLDEPIVRRVVNMVAQSEFKRFQAPPVLQISSTPLGGSQIPLVSRKEP